MTTTKKVLLIGGGISIVLIGGALFMNSFKGKNKTPFDLVDLVVKQRGGAMQVNRNEQNEMLARYQRLTQDELNIMYAAIKDPTEGNPILTSSIISKYQLTNYV